MVLQYWTAGTGVLIDWYTSTGILVRNEELTIHYLYIRVRERGKVAGQNEVMPPSCSYGFEMLCSTVELSVYRDALHSFFEYDSYALYDTCYQRIAHQKGTAQIICSECMVVGKHIQPFQFYGYKSAVSPTFRLDDMLET